MIRYLLALVILFVLMGFLDTLAVTRGAVWLGGHTLVALGFMLFIAFSLGEALRRLGLPALLGYIVTGIALGPGVAEVAGMTLPWTIITDEVMADMGLVNVFVVGVIGLLAGVKFRTRDLAGEWRLVVLLTGAMLLTVVPLTMVGVLFAGQIFPESLAFVSSQSFGDQLVIAGLFGLLAFGLSPSTTVAMIQELRARGPLSTLILGVVLLGGVVLFSLFTGVLTLARHIVGPENLTLATLGGLIPIVLLDLIIALLLGVIVGVATVLYLRYVGKENLLFVVGLIVLAFYVAHRLDVEPLLVFLVAGVFVQNASEQGEELLRALEKIGLPVFIVYFATVAASLDLVVAMSYLPLVVVLMLTRGVGLWAATSLGAAKLTGDAARFDGLWGTFIAQDAVVLVLAGVVALHFPEWGTSFQNVVMTTVIVYLVVGPVLLKFGLDRGGETQRSRELAIAEVEYNPQEIEELLGVEQAEHLPYPDIQDAWLRGSVEDLREEILALEETYIREPLKRQQDVIDGFIKSFDALVQESLSRVEAALKEGDDGPKQIERVEQAVADGQKRFFARAQPLYEPLMAEPAVVVDRQAMEAMLAAIRGMEDSHTLFKVEREPDIFYPGPEDTRAVRYLKVLRRLQRKVFGPGYRSVPLGRLWRYYVELSLPLRFARTVPQIAGQNEALWKEIWRHTRAVDRFFQELHKALERTYETNGSAEEDALEPSQLQARLRRARAMEIVTEFRKSQAHRHEELLRLLARRINVGMLGYGANFGRAYRTFVRGVTRAGTLELPQFRYRPSSRYDQARRAEIRIRERLGRHQQVVEGYRGWLKLDQELVLLSQWFELYKARVTRTSQGLLDDRVAASTAELKSRAQSLLARHEEGEVIDWARAYEEELRPRIQEQRRMIESAMALLHQGVATRTLVDLLETRVARLPEQVEILAQEPERAVLPVGTLYRLPLRHWVVTRLTGDIALRFVEFNERSTTILTERLMAWTNLEQVLEFNLARSVAEPLSRAGDANDSGEEPMPAVSGLSRALKIIEDLDKKGRKENDKVTSWLKAEIDRSVEAAFQPLMERRVGEVQRELARREAASFMARGESWLAGLLTPVAAGWSVLRERGDVVVREVGADVKTLLVEEKVHLERAEVRELLHVGQPTVVSRAPAIYRRLFSPILLDIPDFYLSRPRAEQLCLQVIKEWFEGVPHSLLITGDPGVGKRTLVRHLVPTRVYEVYPELADDQFQTLRLPDYVRDEEELVGHLKILLDGEELVTASLESLAEKLAEATTRRRLVIVDNGAKIFTRSRAGLAMARRFLRMVAATSDKVLWVIVLPRSTSTFLETAVGLEDYFTEICELEGMSGDELTRMIMARHQVSGFAIDFIPARIKRLDRLRYPLLSTDAPGRVQRAYFESLARSTAGNPRLALLSWLRSVRLDESREAQIVVEPLEERRFELLDGLSLNKRLVLAQLAQHDALTLVQLQQILRLPVQHLQVELHQLARMGFVEPLPERVESYQLRTLAEPLVHGELRRQNLI